MKLEDKLLKLNIMPVTDAIYHEHLKHYQLRGVDTSKWKYFKVYGKEPMFYSEVYLDNNTLDELREMDKKNNRMFCPSLIDGIKRKINAFFFKGYMNWRKLF